MQAQRQEDRQTDNLDKIQTQTGETADDRLTERQTDRKIDRMTDTQTSSMTGRPTSKTADRHIIMQDSNRQDKQEGCNRKMGRWEQRTGWQKDRSKDGRSG